MRGWRCWRHSPTTWTDITCFTRREPTCSAEAGALTKRRPRIDAPSSWSRTRSSTTTCSGVCRRFERHARLTGVEDLELNALVRSLGRVFATKSGHKCAHPFRATTRAQGGTRWTESAAGLGDCWAAHRTWPANPGFADSL